MKFNKADYSKLTTGAILLILFLIILTSFKFLNHPVYDNDEGIYSTTYLLVNAGHPLYKSTFFSQLPGFFLTTYSGFILFGKILPAARLTILLWSIIGLFGILWLAYEIKKIEVGFFTIILLFLIPTYYNQIVTFQSDALVLTFSILSLASLLKYKKGSHLIWFIISIIFFTLGFWIKIDVSLIPTLIIIIMSIPQKNHYLKLIFWFLIINAVIFAVLILPFGVVNIVKNFISLRLQAAAVYPFNPFLLLNYLIKDFYLTLIIIFSFIFVLLNKNLLKDFIVKIILTWFLTSLILLIIYRPLFPHHLVFLAFPASLLFAFSYFSIIKQYFNQKQIKFMIIVLLTLVLINRFAILKSSPQELLSSDQKTAVNLITSLTKKNDYVVSDEEILNAVSQRLPPSQLSDISFVRIKSQNLTRLQFKKIINYYQPKLIITWNGRLDSFGNFENLLGDYKLVRTFDYSKKIYSLEVND